MDAIYPLAGFLATMDFEDLPAPVVHRTRLAILDTLAATVAGARGETVPELASLAADWGGTPQATVLASGLRVPMPVATLVNSVAGRAWDLDDVHEQNTCHVTVNIVALALALAEGRPAVDGRAFLAAVAAGCEMVARTSAAPTISFSKSGASNSVQCGYFGAALTAARLMRLPERTMRDALGIAYARLAGNQQGYVEGAMTVRLMQGVAPEGGLVSALMAEKGIGGAHDILEGRFGFYNTVHRGYYDRGRLLDGLGSDWLIHEISIKPVYPCCKYTHGPIEATIAAMDAHALAADAIDHIEISVTNREVYDLVCTERSRKWNPQRLVDAQFSLPFTVAHAAIRRRVGLESFQPPGLTDPAVRAFLPRVRANVDLSEQGDQRGRFPMPGRVTIRLTSGAEIREDFEFVHGHPRKPMDFDHVAEKFRECAAFGGLTSEAAERTIDRLARLETLQDCSDLVSDLSPMPASTAAA